MEKFAMWITTFFASLLIIFLGALIFSFFVMLLWNWLMPAIFSGVSEITWVQALGLCLLSGMLLKSNNTTVRKN